MLALIEQFHDKIKQVEKPKDIFNLYTYNYILENIELLITHLQKTKEWDKLSETTINKIKFDYFKFEDINPSINNLEDIIVVLKVLDKTCEDLYKKFPLFCEMMRIKHGDKADNYLNLISFQAAIVHNKIMALLGDISLIENYQKISKNYR